MARKSYQQGKVVTRKYKYGTAFILRYRVRRPDGSWMQKSMTQRRIRGGCESIKDAQRILDERLRKINSDNGSVAKAASATFADLVGRPWQSYLDTANVKSSKRYSYDSCLRNWILPFFREWPLKDITPLLVCEFMAFLSSRGLSRKYKRNLYGLLDSLFDVAVENDLLPETPIRPKVHRPKLSPEEKSVFSADQARQVLQAVAPPWEAPVWTLALTDLRSGELLGLRWPKYRFPPKTYQRHA